MTGDTVSREPVSARLVYPIRRLWYLVLYPEPACHDRWCPYPIVGFSVWCRRHTDAILRRP